MFRKTVLFCSVLLLCACAGVKQIPTHARTYKRVDFFNQGAALAAFQVTAQYKDQYWRGVLRVKKLDADSYDVLVLGDGAYKLLDAVVAPQGIAWRYIYPEGNKAVIRGRVEQFLNLLLLEPKAFKRISRQKSGVTVTYSGVGASWRYNYQEGNPWPQSVKTVTALNTADMTYAEYAPYGTDEDSYIPHMLVYKDGHLTLDMALIRLR